MNVFHLKNGFNSCGNFCTFLYVAGIVQWHSQGLTIDVCAKFMSTGLVAIQPFEVVSKLPKVLVHASELREAKLKHCRVSTFAAGHFFVENNG